jgi:hypothetical protein
VSSREGATPAREGQKARRPPEKAHEGRQSTSHGGCGWRRGAQPAHGGQREEAGAREDEAVGLEGVRERRGRGGSCGLCEGQWRMMPRRGATAWAIWEEGGDARPHIRVCY